MEPRPGLLNTTMIELHYRSEHGAVLPAKVPRLRAQHDLRGNIQRTHDDRALVQPLFLLWQSAARGNTPRKSTRGHCHFPDSRNGQSRLLHLQRVPLPQLYDHVLLHLQLGRFCHQIRARFSHHGRCQFLNRLIALDVSAHATPPVRMSNVVCIRAHAFRMYYAKLHVSIIITILLLL
ncbi:conserved hypothetical protein [Trichinella spiralis]|uniref:hypothetical protein n=1 Tax=Trichinella spiralis TaxID=6334 RepID=UPI0001EFEC13|nr:conserved hypothetical protein [Trichinella spiralis]